MNIQVALIDDDQSVRRALSRLLHVMKIEAVGYSSAETFIQDPDRNRFSCLLVDVQLGGMTGLELQRCLKAEHNPVPVIFITAFEDPTAQAEAERLGCAGFFQKTDAGARIIHAIRQSVGVGAK